MKRVLTLSLLFLTTSFFVQAQNWHYAGSAQFSNFASDVAITHNTAGHTYIAYANVLDAHKVYVMKYDGNSWSSVGSSAASSAGGSLLSICIDTLTENPWVAYKNSSTNNIDVIKFDSTNWVSRGTINVVPAFKIQIKVANNHAFVATTNSANTVQSMYLYSNRTGPWVSQFTQSVSGTVDLISPDTVYYNVRNYPTATLAHRRVFNGTSWSASTLIKRANNIGYSSQAMLVAEDTNYIMTQHGNTTLGTVSLRQSPNTAVTYTVTTVTNDALKHTSIYRKNKIDGGSYLFYLDQNQVGKMKVRRGLTWSNIQDPGIDLSSLSNNEFAKMDINPVSGEVFIAYNDGGKVSVKYYTLPLPLQRVYVDQNASGQNDGSSWADAYENLQVALAAGISSITTEVWVAGGTYIADTSDKNVHFEILKEGLSVYGGFNGTETALNARDIRANPTILSADLLGNDNGTVLFNTPLRSDNSNIVLYVDADSVTVDGFTFVGAHNTTNGGGLSIKPENTSTIVRHCIFEENVTYGGAGLFWEAKSTGSLLVEKCVFNNNLARWATGVYVYTNRSTASADVDIINCLFTNNETANHGNNRASGGSSAWVRAYSSGSSVNASVVNCTFADNGDLGNLSGVTSRTTLGLSQKAGATITASVNNSIFWNNQVPTVSPSLPDVIGQQNDNFPSTLIVTNSLDTNNFSNVTVKQNNVTGNPRFFGGSNYKVDINSPAVDAGNNTYVPSNLTTDLSNNTRINNTTVDMGVYEFGSWTTQLANIVEEKPSLLIYPNPTDGLVNISSDSNFERIEIYSSIGQKVSTITNPSKQHQINSLETGLYYLYFFIGEERFSKKLIVR